MIPEINSYQCTGCGSCVKECPVQVMGMVKRKAVIIRDLCEECGVCAATCPIDAIYIEMPNGSDDVCDLYGNRIRSLITNTGI